MTTARLATGRIRIGLLDFEPLRVAGLCEILASEPRFDVIATDLADAFHLPDFDLVLFLARKRIESYALLARLKLRSPDMKAIAMAADGDDQAIMTAISAGAKGWLEERASPEQVLEAIDVVLSGSIWAPRRVLSQLVDRALGNGGVLQRAHYPRFTEREEAVLQQLVMARSNREIAHELRIREQTVKSYVARLMRKMGVDNRIALSMQAAQGDWWRTKEL